MGFPEAIKLFFSNYVQFNGRSRRSEFWWPWLLHIIVTVPTLGLGVVMLESSSGDANALAIILVSLGALYFLAVFIPNISLSVRRLHDINLTGWIYLAVVIVGYIPIVGIISNIAMIVIGVVPGTKGPNEYGSDPKNPDGDIIDVFE